MGASSGASVQFPGVATAYLETPWNAAFTFGTGNWTIEAWIFPRNTSSQVAIVSNYTATQGQFQVRRNATNRLEVVTSYGSINTTTGASTFITPNQWNHIAVVRDGTTQYMYVNGVQDTSTLLVSTSAITNTGQVVRVGVEAATVNPFLGFISNVRIVVGTAVYTTNFSPPMNLTAIPNTVYLTCNRSTISDQSSINNTVAVAGTSPVIPQVKTFTPFAGTTPLNANPALGMVQGGVYTLPEMASYRGTKQTTLFDPQFPSTITKINALGYNQANNNDFVADTYTTQTATSTSSSLQQNTFSVSGTVTGTFAVGMEVTGTGVYPGTRIIGYGSGTGGAGSYYLNKYYSPNVTAIPVTATGGYYVATTGTVTQGSPNPYFQQDCFSNYFNGSSALNLATSINALMGNGLAGHTYTIEAWIYPTRFNTANAGRTGFFGNYAASAVNGRWYFGFLASANGAKIMFTWSTGTASEVNQASPDFNIPLNTWTHVAITINATTSANTALNYFVNGQLVYATTGNVFTTQTVNNAAPSIGGNLSGVQNSFEGYISNFRFTYQSMLYTTNFTPSLAPLTATTTPDTIYLGCRSSGFKDASQYNVLVSTFTGAPLISQFSPFALKPYEPEREGASAYFDGTASYLNLLSPPELAVPLANEFRISFWVYFAVNTTTAQYIYDARDTAGQVAPTIYVSGGTLRFATAGVDRITSGALTARQWYYVVISRIGPSTYVTTMYINGVQSGSTYTDASAYVVGTNRPVIGCLGTTVGTSPLTGYLADLRVVVSTNNQTTDTAIPTSPVPLIPHTALLMNFSNGAIYDSSRNIAINTQGNAVIRNIQSKFGGTGNATGSALIGSASSLTLSVPSNTTGVSNPLPVIGDFTVECWFYINSFAAANPTIIFLNGNASDYAALRVQINNTGSITLLVSTTGAAWAINASSATGLVSLSQWYHIAVTRFGTNFTVFLNGQQVNTSTVVVATTALLTASFSRLGGTPITANTSTMYLQDFRITRGARYTTSFTPPTALLPVM